MIEALTWTLVGTVLLAVVLILLLVIQWRKARRGTRLERSVSRVEKRARLLSPFEMEMWAEQSLNDTVRAFTAYRRNNDSPAHLDEAVMGASALSAVLKVALERQQRP